MTEKIFVSKKNKYIKILFCLLLCFLPILLNNAGAGYIVLLMCYFELYVIAVSGLDICFGYSGQISMGHAAFFAIGAYGAGMMHNYWGIPAITSIILASVIATVIGALLAYPASKLVFHFLALATVAFGEIVYQLISHSPHEITGNFIGLFVDRVNFFGLKLNSSLKFYYFGLVCMAIFLLVKTLIVHSKYGRAFVAIRENTHAADGMGINVRKYKVIAFAISAFFTAFAGGMFLYLVGYVSPDTFTQRQSVLFITMLLFGGTASLGGPILGAAAVMLLTEALRSLQSYQLFVYGILMLIAIVAMPGGLYGSLQKLWRKCQLLIRRKKGGNSHA